MRTNHLQYRYELSFHERPSSVPCTFSHLAHAPSLTADSPICITCECKLLSSPLNLSNFCLSFADVSEDDIKLVMEQAQVNRAQAIKALQEHGYAAPPSPPPPCRPPVVHSAHLLASFADLLPETLWMPFLLFRNRHRDINIVICCMPAILLWLLPCKVS
jgi:hypothetical protein